MSKQRLRNVGVSLAAFLSGFAAAALAVGLNLTLASAGGGPPQLEPTTSGQDMERNGGGRGEIAVAHRTIAERVAAVRGPSRRLRGNIQVRMRNVVWNDGPRRPFVRAAAMHGAVDIAAAERGDVVIDGLVVTRANVLLDQPQPGQPWNYERVLADLLENDEGNGNGGGNDNTIRFTNVRIVQSRVEVHQGGTDLALENLDGLASRIQLAAPDTDVPEIDIANIKTTYIDLNENERIVVSGQDALLRLPDDEVDFTVARGTWGSIPFATLEGIWRPGDPGLGLVMAGRISDAELADLRMFSDRLPNAGRGRFNFAIRSLGENSTEVRLSNADIRTEGSHLTGAFTFRTAPERFEIMSADARLDPLSLSLVEHFMEGKLPYGGALTGTVRGSNGSITFGVDARLTAPGLKEPFLTRLDGNARWANGEFVLQHLQAQLRDVPAQALRPIAGGLPFSGNINGTVTLTGPPDRAPLALNVRLELAGGTALVNGTLDLTGAEPVYDLTGRLIGISLGQLFEPELPPVFLTAQFGLRGRSFDPELADAQLNIAGGFTGWRSGPADTVLVAVRVRNGVVAIDKGILSLGPMSLNAQGEWRFVAPQTGALRYTLAIEDLRAVAPFLPALPDTASGVIKGAGTVAGSLERMRIEGEFSGDRVSIAHWSADTLAVKHSLVLGDSVPEIRIEGSARDISSPAKGAYSSATLKLELVSPRFELDLSADRTGGGIVEVFANGHIPYEGARRLVLQRVRLDLGTGRWALVAPAAVEWGNPGGGIDVRNFELRAAGSEGRLRVDGRILPLAQIDARLETAALPLDDLQVLIGREPVLTGALWANADVRGPGESPRFDIEFRVDSGRYEGVPFSRLEGKAEYQTQTLTANAVVTFDTAGTLEVRTTLPVNVAFAPEVDFDLLDNGSVTGSLVADSLRLAAFSGFFPEVQDVQGTLRANARLNGTVRAPNLEGTIGVVGGAATVPSVDRQFTDITADIAFNQRSAEIRKLRARSDGWLEVSGRVEFPQIDNPIANIAVVMEGFRVAGVENRQDAAANGEVRITGPLLVAPVISGEVRFGDGDLPVPQRMGSPLDAELAELAEPLDVAEPGQRSGSLFDRVRIDDLRLTAGEGLWFSMRNARAQLRGTLTVNKPGEDLLVTGTLTGERGTYTLEAGPIIRRFEIVKAEVRFLGATEINPAIDVTARRVIVDATGREMDIEVRVTGTVETPTLSIASQDASQIPQSELLSYLLFGQGSVGLGGGNLLGVGNLPGVGLFEETYLSGLAELASLEIEDALGAPFDLFQIRLGGGAYGGLASPTFVIGREIRDNVFLTVESGIAALFGPGAAENSVANTWAVRLEWRIDTRTMLRAGYEPVNRSRLIRGLGVALPATRRQQVAVELRRRWSW